MAAAPHEAATFRYSKGAYGCFVGRKKKDQLVYGYVHHNIGFTSEEDYTWFFLEVFNNIRPVYALHDRFVFLCFHVVIMGTALLASSTPPSLHVETRVCFLLLRVYLSSHLFVSMHVLCSRLFCCRHLLSPLV